MGHHRDRAAIGVLAGLPIVMFVLPALAGHPIWPGDDLIQNFPLRVLAGAQLRHGHLPLFNPYIWSGAPLLASWNAGALYPLTFLFAVLPGAAAWTAGLTLTWWVAGLGTYAFLRASRLAPVASAVGALSFAFAGAMTAQISHFGLVAGMSWVPVALLAVLRLSGHNGLAARLPWLIVLAGTTGLVILAGEPRAIDDALVIVVLYAGWRAWRPGRWRAGAAFLAVVLAGLALGVALGAVQWLPGLEAVGTSQRHMQSTPLFDSGSLPGKWLLLWLVPDLLGGSGSFGQPAFFASYNLTEVTGYAGLMPLAAAVSLLGQVRRRPLPEWLIWHLVALAGLVLALGGNTPAGHLLVHLPFFGGQRLQSRNMVIAGFGFAVLLAYWADRWLAEPRARGRAGSGRLPLAVAPGLAVIGVAVTALGWGPGMWQWLGLSPARASQSGGLRPWLVPSLLLGLLAVALAWWGPRLQPARRARALVTFVVADLVVFTLLAVVAVAPGPGGTASPAGAALGGPGARVVPIGTFTHGGRFAVYDPGQRHGGELTALGAPDGNILSQTPSIEGYSSLVDAAYAKATGSHQATGEGQNVLGPQAIGDGTLDQLGTTTLVTLPDYLLTSPGQAQSGTGSRTLARGQTATWYFGTTLPVASVTIPVTGPSTAAGGIRIGLARPSGETTWLTATPAPGGGLRAVLPHPVPAVTLLATAGTGVSRLRLAPPALRTAAGTGYRADGPLQDALVPPRWQLTGFDGAFAVFRDAMAKPPLTLQAVPGKPAAGAWVRATAGPGFAPTGALVSSPRGVTVIRAAAAIPGWTASWQPAGRTSAMTLPVRRVGLVQAVTVPPGHGTLRWAYHAPGARAGLVLTLLALAVLAGLGSLALAQRRRGHAGQATASPPRPDQLGWSSPGKSARRHTLAPYAGAQTRAGPADNY